MRAQDEQVDITRTEIFAPSGAAEERDFLGQRPQNFDKIFKGEDVSEYLELSDDGIVDGYGKEMKSSFFFSEDQSSMMEIPQGEECPRTAEFRRELDLAAQEDVFGIVR